MRTRGCLGRPLQFTDIIIAPGLRFESEQFNRRSAAGPATTKSNACLRALRSELDHRYLNEEVVGLNDRPITTESLARYIFERVNTMMPLHRVRLHERQDFFAEAWAGRTWFFSDYRCRLMRRIAYMRPRFPIARTRSSTVNATIPPDTVIAYLTETTIGGDYDKRSGTLYDFVALNNAIHESLKPWQDRHLDLETDDFRCAPSTGENIVRALWPKIDNRLNQRSGAIASVGNDQ